MGEKGNVADTVTKAATSTGGGAGVGGDVANVASAGAGVGRDVAVGGAAAVVGETLVSHLTDRDDDEPETEPPSADAPTN